MFTRGPDSLSPFHITLCWLASRCLTVHEVCWTHNCMFEWHFKTRHMWSHQSNEIKWFLMHVAFPGGGRVSCAVKPACIRKSLCLTTTRHFTRVWSMSASSDSLYVVLQHLGHTSMLRVLQSRRKVKKIKEHLTTKIVTIQHSSVLPTRPRFQFYHKGT